MYLWQVRGCVSPYHCPQPAHPRHLPRGDGLHLAAVRRHDGARDAVLQHGDQPPVLYCTVYCALYCTGDQPPHPHHHLHHPLAPGHRGLGPQQPDTLHPLLIHTGVCRYSSVKLRHRHAMLENVWQYCKISGEVSH